MAGTPDKRHDNTGDPSTLATKIDSARDTAPDRATDVQILRVAYTAYQEQRDPAELWREVSVQ